MLKLLTKLLIITLCAMMLCGCSVGEINETAQVMYEESAVSKDEEISVDDLKEEFSKDLLEKNNDRILKFFSDSTIEKYGEDHIRDRLEMAEALLQGEYVEEELEYDGKTGTRGGKGKDIDYYTIVLTTDSDKYSICFSWSNGDSTNGYFSDDFEASKKLIHLSIFPESVMYDEEGNYDFELADKINAEGSCICFPEETVNNPDLGQVSLQ